MFSQSPQTVADAGLNYPNDPYQQPSPTLDFNVRGFCVSICTVPDVQKTKHPCGPTENGGIFALSTDLVISYILGDQFLQFVQDAGTMNVAEGLEQRAQVDDRKCEDLCTPEPNVLGLGARGKDSRFWVYRKEPRG